MIEYTINSLRQTVERGYGYGNAGGFHASTTSDSGDGTGEGSAAGWGYGDGREYVPYDVNSEAFSWPARNKQLRDLE